MDETYPINSFLNVCTVLEEAMTGDIKYVMAGEDIYQELKMDESGEYARHLSADLAAFYSVHNWSWKTGILNSLLTYVIDEDTIYIYTKIDK